MRLQGVMRKQQASQRGCWAEEGPGAAPAACSALRETWPLTSLAYEVRPWSLHGVGPSRAPGLLPRRGVPGAPGRPEAPLEEDGGAPKRGRGVPQPATDRRLGASCMGNTGALGGRRRAVASRAARAQRHARCPHRSRLGPRSRSPGKLGTPGGGLQATAPRLREAGTKGPQRTRTLSPGHARWRGSNGQERCERLYPRGEGPTV